MDEDGTADDGVGGWVEAAGDEWGDGEGDETGGDETLKGPVVGALGGVCRRHNGGVVCCYGQYCCCCCAPWEYIIPVPSMTSMTCVSYVFERLWESGRHTRACRKNLLAATGVEGSYSDISRRECALDGLSCWCGSCRLGQDGREGRRNLGCVCAL